ncbi:hypothetical protein [Streptomyces sp. NPDC059788]|uniref:hypothetical protein n=1 Tax=Streptomyces sp. NPDC059788 TaxID=3346948 RepID=UPI0036486AF9
MRCRVFLGEAVRGSFAARRNTYLNHALNAVRHHPRSHDRLPTTVAREVIEPGLHTSPDGQRTDTALG